MKTKFAFAATLIASVIALPVMAQTNIDQRQVNQDRRIEQGEQSGSLTNHEAKRLEKGEAHIDKMEAKAKSDGVVSQKENARIEHAENKESRAIYRQKHDAQHDFNHDGRNDRRERRVNRRN
ncbi:MAG TPA: hypothetical protein VL381_08120 [Rhodocyclaceae bacterium]|jgi:uncharacterized membrane protein YebE (DUF533 family)|nr:hypothetical protein [Rhodocyclaceae bacterium]